MTAYWLALATLTALLLCWVPTLAGDAWRRVTAARARHTARSLLRARAVVVGQAAVTMVALTSVLWLILTERLVLDGRLAALLR